MAAQLIEAPKRERWEPVPAVVEHCYKLLELAKSGQLRAIAYAVVEAGDGEEDGWAYPGLAHASRTRFALSHAIRMLEEQWTETCQEARRSS